LILTNKNLSDLAEKYLETALYKNRNEAIKLIMAETVKGVKMRNLYLDVLQPCQYEIGDLWETGQINVAQEHFFTAITQLLISQLYSYFPFQENRGLRAVITCTPGELHEVGARMVADFFETEGWDTCFLGANTPVKDVMSLIRDWGANLLGVSVTIALNIPAAIELISRVREHFPPDRLKILVGGRVFKVVPGLRRKVSADDFAPDAGQAVQIAETYFTGR
jgi:methanogenic corrinoid protein MtbC1